MKTPSLIQVTSYPLGPRTKLIIAEGSVCDYSYSLNKQRSGIVNAANEECLGGGGVDGAISIAGGKELLEARLRLPPLEDISDSPQKSWNFPSALGWGKKNKIRKKPGNFVVRCKTGDAKVTKSESDTFGKLHVPYVMHAVGPNYSFQSSKKADALLRNAYTKSIKLAVENEIEGMAFALLSAGVYRGTQSVEHVLGIGVKAIADECSSLDNEINSLNEVVMCGYNKREVATLVRIAKELKLEEELKEQDDVE